MNKNIYISLILMSLIFSQFNWDDNGVPIRQGYHIEWQRTADVGNNEEVIFAWSDTRVGDRDVYVKKISSTGEDLWGANGKPVIVAPGRQEDPQLVSDGNGGAYVIWKDYRDEPDDGDFYAQHILFNGEPAWNPLGVPLTTVTGKQSSPNLCKDGVGGAFAIWKDESAGSGIPDLYGTHLGPNESDVINPGVGVLLNSSDLSYGGVSLEVAAQGSAILVWSYNNGTNLGDLYAQRIDSNCNTLWSSPVNGGIPIYEGSGVQESSRVTYYDENYSIIVWEDDRSGDDDIYAQFVDMNGNLVFNNAIEVSMADDRQYKPRVKANNLGAYVIWYDLRNNLGSTPVNNDIYMQRLTVENGLEWDDSIVVASSDGESSNFLVDHTDARLTVDSFGSVYVAWMQDKLIEGTYDIGVQKVDDNGNLLLSLDQSNICDSQNRQESPIVREDGVGGAFVVWGDSRLGSIGIYSQHISQNGDMSFLDNGLESFWGIDGNTVSSYANKPQSKYLGNNQTIISWPDQRFGQELKNFGQKISVSWDGSQNSNGNILSDSQAQDFPIIENVGDNIMHVFPDISAEIKLKYQMLDGDLSILGDSDGSLVNPLSSSPHFYNSFDIASNEQGFYLAFSELEFFAAYNIFIQIFDSQGLPQFSQAIGITQNFGADENVRSIHDIGDNSLLVIYDSESFSEGRKVKAIAIDYSGNVLEGWESGINVCNYNSNQTFQTSIDVDNGIFVLWNDDRGDGDDIYGQFLDASGIAAEPNGLSVAVFDSYQQNSTVAYNSIYSEILVCWQDYVQNSYYDVSCRTIDSNDFSLNNVFKVADVNLANQINPFVIASITGDYLIVWQDSRNYSGSVAPNDDVYLQQLSNGEFVFDMNGIPVCNAVFSQTYPQIELYDESDNSYVVFWNDLRSSGKADLVNIYAQSISLNQCEPGDLNADNIVNVIDVVALVSIVLNPGLPSNSDLCSGDFNSDSIINVIDIVALVNLILSN